MATFDFFKSHSEVDEGMSEERAHFYFRQLLKGVEVIHAHGVVHRDLVCIGSHLFRLIIFLAEA